MDQPITPAIRCNDNADEAAQFYIDASREGPVVEQVPNYAATISIRGFQLSLIDGGNQDALNPSASCILNFDPPLFDGEERTRAYLDEFYEHLSASGVFMELGEYLSSPRYVWVCDRFDIAWQLTPTDPAGEPHPFIPSPFMFGGTNHANAEEAIETWITSFDGARCGILRRYGEGGPIETGAVMFIDFTLRGTWMAAMDSGAFHNFTFTPGVSMIVPCRDQAGIDRYWAGLSAVPETEHCGQCVDRWGVSWQVIPYNTTELMADAVTREKLLRMNKTDLAGL